MIAALEPLDDRVLRVIGIYRGQIRSIVDSFDDRELRVTPVSPSIEASADRERGPLRAV